MRESGGFVAKRKPVDRTVRGPLYAVAAYIRVSKERDEMITEDLQKEAIDKFVATQITDGKPWEVVATFRDIDVSGRSFEREGITQAIEGAMKGEWHRIVVRDYTRFGRVAGTGQMWMMRLEAAGAGVVSATEPTDGATAHGKLSRGVLMQIAEFQSNTISEHWKATQRHRIAGGLPSGGQPRCGYVDHSGKKGDCAIEGCDGSCVTGYYPHPSQGAALRECFI